jgi:hypothetical protein
MVNYKMQLEGTSRYPEESAFKLVLTRQYQEFFKEKNKTITYVRNNGQEPKITSLNIVQRNRIL